MNTISRLKNYWIGMGVAPFIMVIAAAMYEDDLEDLFTNEYLFSEMMLVFVVATIAAIIGSYIASVLKEALTRDIHEIKLYYEERRLAQR